MRVERRSACEAGGREGRRKAEKECGGCEGLNELERRRKEVYQSTEGVGEPEKEGELEKWRRPWPRSSNDQP